MFNFLKKIKDKIDGSKPEKEEKQTEQPPETLEDKPDAILEKEIKPETEDLQTEDIQQEEVVEEIIEEQTQEPEPEPVEEVIEEPQEPESEPVEGIIEQPQEPAPAPVEEIKEQPQEPAPEPVEEIKEQPQEPEPEPVEEIIEEPQEPAPEPVEEIVVEPQEPAPVPVEEIIEEPQEPAPEPVEEIIEEPQEPEPEPIEEIIEEPQEPEPEPVEEIIEAPQEPAPEPVEEVIEKPQEPAPVPVEEIIEEPQEPAPEPVEEIIEEPQEPEPEPIEEIIEQPQEPAPEPVEEIIEEETEKRPKGWFGLTLSSFKNKISKTSDTLINSVVSIATGRKVIDDDVIDEIEEKLIKADIGLDTAVEITEKLRDNMHKITPENLKDYLREEFTTIIKSGSGDIELKYTPNRLNIYLVTGVNGVGKTTLIGKLANRFTEQGKKVLIAAGDTFRAAAEQQLDIWSKRANADIVRRDGADPASVVFDAIEKAKKENYDVLLIDTAGRLHNKFNLMQELGKIRKIIDKQGKEYLAESLLVLDATTGQNGLQQARIFQEAVQLTSVALTKLDGSAKGGIIIAIASELKLPVKLVGVGEKIDDLRDFDPDVFMEALFS